MSHSAENFNSRIFHYCNNFGYRKSLDKSGGEGGYQDFPSTFLPHSAEKFRRGVLYCCNSFGYRENLVKEGEVSRFSV